MPTCKLAVQRSNGTLSPIQGDNDPLIASLDAVEQSHAAKFFADVPGSIHCLTVYSQTPPQEAIGCENIDCHQQGPSGACELQTVDSFVNGAGVNVALKACMCVIG